VVVEGLLLRLRRRKRAVHGCAGEESCKLVLVLVLVLPLPLLKLLLKLKLLGGRSPAFSCGFPAI
jgi:hypothetical protein